jgi:hypothetical protein
MMSALAMQEHTLTMRPDIKIQGHMVHRNSRIAQAREWLAADALNDGADAILWIDSDQVFPADLALRLLGHGLPFVGCNYRKRRPEAAISASANLIDGQRVPIKPQREGLEPVDLLGFGAVLTSAEIFRAVPRPWFEDGPQGEDGYFSLKAKAAGFQPQIDHGIKVGHITETVLTFPD